MLVTLDMSLTTRVSWSESGTARVTVTLSPTNCYATELLPVVPRLWMVSCVTGPRMGITHSPRQLGQFQWAEERLDRGQVTQF